MTLNDWGFACKRFGVNGIRASDPGRPRLNSCVAQPALFDSNLNFNSSFALKAKSWRSVLFATLNKSQPVEEISSRNGTEPSTSRKSIPRSIDSSIGIKQQRGMRGNAGRAHLKILSPSLQRANFENQWSIFSDELRLFASKDVCCTDKLMLEHVWHLISVPHSVLAGRLADITRSSSIFTTISSRFPHLAIPAHYYLSS